MPLPRAITISGAALGILGAQTAAGAAEDWRAIARQDARAAYQLYFDNHPGMYDPANPGFRGQLARARARALAIADRATEYSDYVDALGAFSAEFADGHARLIAKPPIGQPDTQEWPGFVAAWRGNGLYVHSAAPDFTIPPGSPLLGCDGKDAAGTIRNRLILRGFRQHDAGHWWARSPQAFLSTSLTRRQRPQRCTFRLVGGARRTLALQWTAAPPDITARISAAADGDRTPIGMSEPRKGLFLIGLPDFNPDDAGIAAYRALGGALVARRGDFLRARAIVIDLRHNDGGSSEWSRQVADALFGAAAVEDAMVRYFHGVEVWWRASAGNIDFLSGVEKQMRDEGRADSAQGIASSRAGMQAALAQGKPYYVALADEGGRPARRPVRSDLRVPVYVITPGRCASACLDALDTFTRFPNVRLIGAPTASDTAYLDARPAELPSGLGLAVIPNKMWVGRPRKSRQFYRPAIEVRDLDWSTATFLNRIERDLAARSSSNRQLSPLTELAHRRRPRPTVIVSFLFGSWTEPDIIVAERRDADNLHAFP